MKRPNIFKKKQKPAFFNPFLPPAIIYPSDSEIFSKMAPISQESVYAAVKRAESWRKHENI